jgi:hypothetical protein
MNLDIKFSSAIFTRKSASFRYILLKHRDDRTATTGASKIIRSQFSLYARCWSKYDDIGCSPDNFGESLVSLRRERAVEIT